MLDNVLPASELAGLYRRRRLDTEKRSVHPADLEKFVSEGWQVDRHLKRVVKVVRPKPRSRLLEDRVWCLMYRMGFPNLSGEGGAQLITDPGTEQSVRTQIDVVAVDDEVALAVECKTAERPAKRPQFAEELSKFELCRQGFARAVNEGLPSGAKRPPVLVLTTENILLSDNDKQRASNANVLLLDGDDVRYYEALVAQLGPAARYQFLADMLPGRPIPGLAIRLPAIRSKMGSMECYTFSITPEYLLKVGYVSHRAKGKGSDIKTYQRMLNKSRIEHIRQYISDNGIFPTNVVVNLDSNRVRFERVKQEPDTNDSGGILGWLDIRPTYKAAWIIDGQHRLFAYSGHPAAAKDRLSVLAFKGLAPSKQAELFIDINAKQKSVKQSLLQELFAELHWDAAKPAVRSQAIISKAIQVLDYRQDSPFYHRVKTADAERDATRCITVGAMFRAIQRGRFHIIREHGGQPVEFGPLWAGDNDSTLERTVRILSEWFTQIRDAVPDWWELGSGEGGGLAMNDGVESCVDVLRSVFEHMEKTGLRPDRMSTEQLCEELSPYSAAVGEYLASLNVADRKRFRDLRGVQGQTTRVKRFQAYINSKLPTYNPDGLQEFLDSEQANTNEQATRLVRTMELLIQKHIVSELRETFGEYSWWTDGVPQAIRMKASQRQEQDNNKRGNREYYLDLIDYRGIIEANWQLFETTLAFGKTGKKEARTQWLVHVNEVRNTVAHPSAMATVSLDDLARLERYSSWLEEQLTADDEQDGVV